MGIGSNTYRTFTYIAGDWDADIDVVNQLKHWNESNYWGLRFKDVHDLTSSRDSSLNCTIKRSLRDRMSVCKTFVLIVGEHTRRLTGGSCGNCCYHDYSYTQSKFICSKGYPYDSRGYVDFECDLAKASNINVIVLYKGLRVDKSNCPDSLKNIGQHVAMKHLNFDNYGRIYEDWNYKEVKEAFDKIG